VSADRSASQRSAEGVRDAMSPKVLMERSQEEMLREVEMRRQNQALRAERERPAASLRVSTVAWRLMRVVADRVRAP
jgi:hypothetical protein